MTIDFHLRPGSRDTAIPADQVGCFLIRPVPASPFRLRCRTADGSDILTGSITL